jgi:diguanylate cyclase
MRMTSPPATPHTPSISRAPITDDSHIAIEWRNVVEHTSPAIRTTVARWIEQNQDALITRYRTRMMADPQVADFLVTPLTQQAFCDTVRDWLMQTLSGETEAIDARIAQQRQVGATMARINYPIQAVARGARKLKGWIITGLEGSDLTERELLQAAAYISNLFDISMELRNMTYLRDTARQSRNDEAYRVHSLGQNIAMERERQRAALMEWGHTVLVDFHRVPRITLPRLAQSDFGLWLNHKASTLFEGSTDVDLVNEAVDRIDRLLLPRLDAALPQEGALTGELVGQLQSELAAIKFSVAGLFEHHIEVENGRDTLTRLLNRRFLSTVLTREIALHRRTGQGGFAVLILDLDYFKQVNDKYGHDTGDVVLQQAATLVVSNVRPSDFVFRYGGEEILIVLVESDAETAAQVAENIRQRFESASFAVANGVTISVTVSIGVEVYQGRPDYQPLLTAADNALYRAKAGGRNRVMMA